MLVSRRHACENGTVGRFQSHHASQAKYNVFNSALEACSVHPVACRSISNTEFSSMDFCDAEELEKTDEILLEMFLGKSFQGEHPQQG